MTKKLMHRVSLSEDHIRLIIEYIVTDIAQTEDKIELMKICRLKIFKAEEGISKPAYVSNKESIEEKLGFSNEVKDKDELRRRAYLKYTANEKSCSVKDLELAHTYRWEKGLMSREEEILFEGNPHKFLSAGMIDTDSPLLDSEQETDNDTNTNTNT